jgi:hypothetical protein
MSGVHQFDVTNELDAPHSPAENACMSDDFLSRLLLAIHGISETDLGRPEGDGRWSVLAVLAHLADFEALGVVRLRMVLGQDDPKLPALAQEAMVATHHGETLASLVEQLGFHRRQRLALAARLDESQRARTGVHPDYGPLSIDELLRRAEVHQEKHLGQIVRIVATLGLHVSEAPQIATPEAAHVADAPVRTFGEGVRVRDIWRSGVKRALQVEFDAGAQWPGLDHHVPGPEEVFVLAGDFEDDGKVHGPGTFLHYPAGTSHSPRSSAGCTLFVFYPEG